ASSIPAADSGHPRMAARSGIAAVEMVRADRRPAQILTSEAYEDAVTTVLAMCGSTNAVIHLIAMARRSGVPLSLDDFDEVARNTPVLANIRPMGAYLMEDFYYAGGLRALLAQLGDLLHLDRLARIDDPDLAVDENSVLVLRGAGPLGGPGMPEHGMLPIPDRLLKQGVRDMVRVSDARMSGTSYGACVLHVAPESHAGGPLALVHNGDVIELDVAKRRLTLAVSDEELAKRRAGWTQPAPKYARGYGALY